MFTVSSFFGCMRALASKFGRRRMQGFGAKAPTTVRILALTSAVFSALSAAAEEKRAQFAFFDERGCISKSRFSPEQCANAAANAAAEFEEKAPRFATRDACERAFRRGGCSIGLSGVSLGGTRPRVYFTPRQEGFHIFAPFGREPTVLPTIRGADISFSPREISRRNVHINPAAVTAAAKNWDQRSMQSRAGLSDPSAQGGEGSVRGPIPPPPADPNFNCAQFLEPGANAQGGCYPAPMRRK